MKSVRLIAVATVAAAILLAATLMPGALRRNAASLTMVNLVAGAWCDAQVQDALENRLRRADAAGETVQAEARLVRLDALRDLCADPARVQMEEAARLSAAAARCAGQGDWECAQEQAERALALDPRRVDGRFTLYQAHSALDQPERAVQALAAPAPEYPLTAEFPGCWRLVGYDLSMKSLELNGQLEMTLHWRTPATASGAAVAPLADGALYRIGDRAYQVISTPNLVINGGFELTDTVGDRIALGFPEDRYRGGKGRDRLLGARRIRVAERNGRHTLCAELDNTQASPTGLVSDPLPAAPGELYLMGALALNAGDGTRVGMLRQRPEENLRNAYVSQVGTTGEWTVFSGVLPVVGDTQAISLQLLNQDQGRIVCLDNAFLLRVAPPVGLEDDGGD